MLHARTVLLFALALQPAIARAQETTAPPGENPRLEWAGAVGQEHRAAAVILRAARRGNDTPALLLQRLTGLREPGIPALLDILEQGRIPRPTAEDPPQLLNTAQSQLLLAALALLPEPAVRAELEARLAQEPVRDEVRLGALRLFAAIGDPRDLPRLAGLTPRVEEDISHPARAALRTAYVAILEREPGAFAQSAELVQPQDLPAARELLLAAGQVRDSRALVLLESTARSVPPLAQLAVSIVPEVGASNDLELVRSFGAWLLGRFECGSPEWKRVVLRALGVLDDGRAVPTMIDALEDEDLEVVYAAREALQCVSGLKLGAEPGPWRAWHSAEDAWWRNERGRARTALVSKDASAVLQALARYGERRLFREELAQDVLTVLERHEPALRRFACETLARLEARIAFEPLTELFVSSAPGVADAAWKAACTISGRVLPRDGLEARALLASN